MNDLISRSALIKRRRKVVEYDEAGFSMDYFAVSVEEINKAQTVEAKPVVRGEWEEAKPRGVTRYSKGYAECSACHNIVWSGWEMDFCPKCGADMRGKKNA